MRILVVEDDPLTLELTTRVIEHMGHAVKPGWLVIGELRSDERFRTTPIIAVSAGTTEDRDRAMTAGATAFFRKPYDPAALRAALEQFATT
jgi:CheY-like chemotaxis protein